jgi:hypothetical protein
VRNIARTLAFLAAAGDQLVAFHGEGCEDVGGGLS